MAKLHRPYILLAVRVKVAERQFNQRTGLHACKPGRMSDGRWLIILLSELFGDKKYALDHNPALVNRRQRKHRDGSVSYIPDANDPDFLLYREDGPGSNHDIKTRVRGDGAQLSDLAIARKRKRREKKMVAQRAKQPNPKIGRKRQPKRKAKYSSGLKPSAHIADIKRAKRKFKWPKRPMRSRR